MQQQHNSTRKILTKMLTYFKVLHQQNGMKGAEIKKLFLNLPPAAYTDT